MKQNFKITGTPETIDISGDGSYIIMGTYEGSFQIYGLEEKKLLFKTKIKGTRSHLPIKNQGISFDNRYFAFSCLFKVFIVDFHSKEIIKEIDYSQNDERQSSISFCFFNTQNKIAIPNGGQLLIYDIEKENMDTISLPQYAGQTNQIAINTDDTVIAYKSRSESFEDKLYLIDLKKKQPNKTIPLPYPQSRGNQLYMCCLKFISEQQLVVLRKGIGFSYFDITSGKEIKTITWGDLGFRSLHDYDCSRISDDGKYLLIRKEMPNRQGQDIYDIDEWIINLPEGKEYVIYDTGQKKIIHTFTHDVSPANFHIETSLLAYIKTDYSGEKTQRTLVIETFSSQK